MTLAQNFGFNYPPNAKFDPATDGAGGGTETAQDPKAGEMGGGDLAAQLAAANAAKAAAEAKALELQQTNDRLAQHWEKTKTLIRPDVSPEEASAALVELYKAQGMSEEQIRLVLNPPAPAGDPNKKGKDEDKGDPEIKALNTKLADLEQQVGSQRAEQARQEQLRLENELTDLSGNALDTNKDLATLVQKLTSLSGDDPQAEEVVQKATALRETLTSEIRERARARLLARRQAAGGRWSNAWMAEETEAASKDIHAKYKSILPSPERLGRAPEIDTIEDQLSRTQPVKAPEFKPGMTADKANAELKNWGVDYLLRGAGASGTKTRA